MNRAPYASDPAHTRGREFGDDRAAERGPRTAFQRDRDRIVHSIAFRRLRGKTQVFIAPDGDHYRTRLTHSLEVAQIGRVIARELRLDEDLTEALCLAHDIGHPPFGHAGERALDAAMTEVGGFDHNAHTIRTLARLDSPYLTHRGLNLSWEVLEGLAKHNGPVADANWALSDIDAAFPLELGSHGSLEAQVASLADDIAYDNHDIDDGIRAGFLQIDELLSLDFVADRFRTVERAHPAASRALQMREVVRSQIGAMVNDLLTVTRANASEYGSVEAIRAAPAPVARFSPEMAEQERRLKAFLYDKLYYHPEQVETAERAHTVIARLTAAYLADPSLLPDGWRDDLPSDGRDRTRRIGDFLAGMTDRYAIDRYGEIFGTRPEGLQNV